MASWAFFYLAADTIFMALVIFMVDPMDAILLRISFKFAILYIIINLESKPLNSKLLMFYSYFTETSFATFSKVAVTSSVNFPAFNVSSVSLCFAFKNSR